MRSVFDNVLSLFNKRSYSPYSPYIIQSQKAMHPVNVEVDAIRPELEEALPKYNKIRDCLKGEDHVKSLGDLYLPRPSTEKSREEELRYQAYVRRADFLNATGFTQRTTIGKLFTKPATIDLPFALQPLVDNVNGEGLSFEQLIERLVGEVFAFGRAGLYADFRSVQAGNVSLADIIDLAPTLTLVRPEDIINWRINKETKQLTMVVVREYFETYDGFAVIIHPQYRVFMLEENNLVVQVWQPATGTEREARRFQLVSEDRPLLPGGVPWEEIPFAVVGSSNNDWVIDEPPLYSLANLDFSLYRNSADIEEAAHIVGQPTPYVAGLRKEWVDEFGLHKLRFGSGQFIPLPDSDSKVGLIQPSAETMLDKLIANKGKQMREQGALLVSIDNLDNDQTATGAIYQALQIHAPLVTASRNVVAGVRKAIGYAAMFVGIDPETDEIEIKLNSDILDNPLGITGLRTVLEMWNSGLLTFEEAREQVRIQGMTLHTPEEARVLLDQERVERAERIPDQLEQPTEQINPLTS